MIIFKTSDLHLASFLRLNGYNLDNIVIFERRGEFHFHDVNQELVDQYFLEQTTVEPIAFMNAVRSLSTAVRRNIDNFNEKGRGNQ